MSLLPRLLLRLDEPAPAVLASLFPTKIDAVRLEIGFGGGEHLIGEALAQRQTGFIGCEPYVNGIAKVLALIEAHAIGNVRLYDGDAINLLAWLPDRELERLDLLYPDPWPKRRHWKRRFVQHATVAMMARVLRPGGLFRFATDVADYAEWTLARFMRSPAFVLATALTGQCNPWPDFNRTRYEAKALREGRTPHYLAFRRTAQANDAAGG